MKKFVLCLLLLLSCVSIQAKDGYYYVIKGNSETIKELYTLKNELLESFKEWSKGADSIESVIQDQVSLFENAYYQDRTLFIIVDAMGDKILSGELKTSYCEEDIKVKSLILEWLGY